MFRRAQAINNDNQPRFLARRSRTPFSDNERRKLLIGVNTVGPRWKLILDADRNAGDAVFLPRRSNVDLKDLYNTLARQGFAIAKNELPTLTNDEDCFTEAAMETFHIAQGERDDAVMMIQRGSD